MLYDKSQAPLSLQPKAILYPVDMTLGKRIKSARKSIPKLTQTVLGDALGVSDKAVSQWERDIDKPTQDKFPKLAEVLRQSVAYLHGEKEHAAPSRSSDGNVNQPQRINAGSRTQALNIVPGADLMGEEDLPVYSIVQAGKGALVLENDPFTYTKRPRRLIGIAKGYGVRIKGNSMSPEYNEDDIAYVDPSLNARKGDPCVFQGEREDGTMEAMMKYLDRSPDAHATLYYVRTGLGADKGEQKFTIKKADWQKCHVAVGKESGR